MAKELRPVKIIITLDNKGDFEDGVLLYKTKEGGEIRNRYKSISIKNMKFSKLHLAEIIDSVVVNTKEKEKLND